MKYWITTHWAPEDGDESSAPRGIWVPDGREQAGADLRKGDCVLIYQATGGPTEIREGKDGEDERIGRRGGSGGVVVVGQVLDRLRANGAEVPTRYVGRKDIWWRWHADTKLISSNGFVPVNALKRVLDFSPGYRMRGFGDYNSGLKEITEGQYNELVRLFRNRTRKRYRKDVLAKRRHRQKFAGVHRGESDAHKFLKEYVASNPSSVLGERGLKTLKVEFPFDSGDRADVVLEDHAGRVIGLEIEVRVDPTDVVGILQAIKYRYMLAFVHRCRYQETRSFLVAYSITPEIRKICGLYAVECYTVPRQDVLQWKRQERTNGKRIRE